MNTLGSEASMEETLRRGSILCYDDTIKETTVQVLALLCGPGHIALPL